MKKLSVAFFATPQIAVPSLETLVEISEVEIAFVGVFPDKKVGRKQVLTPCPVKMRAQELGLRIREIASPQDIVETFSTPSFDLAIVIAFGMIFPGEVFGDKDIVNVHFSSLPLYRGASPVQSAILHGDQSLGLTFQQMVHALDEGDILHHKSYDITGQTTGEVWEDFAQYTADEMTPFIQGYIDGGLEAKPQEGDATYCSKFRKEDGRVDLKKDDPPSIYRKYLAFTPWPGIYTQTPKGRLKLTDITLENDQIIINRAQLEGKPQMAWEEILKGNPELATTVLR